MRLNPTIVTTNFGHFTIVMLNFGLVIFVFTGDLVLLEGILVGGDR